MYLLRTLLLLSIIWVAGGAAPERQPARPGKDYALFFAVGRYAPPLDPLPQVIPNAVAIAAELHQTYGFDTLVVRNPSKAQIIATLREYEARFANGRLPADGQLLVFFLGHGKSEFGEGYFLPANAQPADLNETALGYDYWRKYIGNFNCRHVLVGVDACHSATFDPSYGTQSGGRLERPGGELTEEQRLLEDHQRYKARLFFTSDSQDDVTPGQSNFARQLLEGLRSLRYQTVFSSSELFAGYIDKARPTPKDGTFEGHEAGGRFLFFRQALRVHDAAADRAAWQAAQQAGTAEACRQYLRNFPEGDFAASARRCVDEKEAEQRELAAWQTARQTNTPEGYQSFMNAYPQSPYYTEAENRRRELLNKPAPAPTQASTPAPTQAPRTTPPAGMVLVRGGTFEMGDVMNDNEQTDEKPVHTVTVSDFYLATHELSFAEYDAFCTATGRTKPSDRGWGRDRRPVINVSWHDAVAYCNWRSQQERLQAVYTITGDKVSANWNANGYRLPTEAEWEYAARQGGQKVRFGDGQNTADPARINFDASANGKKPYSIAGTYRQKTIPVGSLNAPNSLGLHDMSGNVWEWCWDWYGSYTAAAQTNPHGPDSGSYRVKRGGSWFGNPADVRAANRYSNSPGLSSYSLGFRLARAVR